MEQISQLAQLGLFDAKVPRYTSYPTAPHFSTAVQARQFGEWIGAIPEGSGISLYLHIPFCRRLCWFCACRTQGVRSKDPVEAYLATLKDEIGLVAKALPKDVKLARMHWGGGTPTLLDAAQIADLAKTVTGHIPFQAGAEFSVEIDPNEVDDTRLDALAAAGMNRSSIGIQDFDPKIQEVIGREQGFEVTKAVVDKLRARGIRSLNADVLFGLPHQTTASIDATTRKLLDLRPDRVALYGYAHVPWMAKRQTMIPEEHLPNSVERLGLFEHARDIYLEAGYRGIGIDHFALADDGLAVAEREGRLRRNFQGYTDDDCSALIGLGASAISKFRQGYVQNASATASYLAQVRAGVFASARGHRLTPTDQVRARVIEQIMCSFGLDLDSLRAEFGEVPASLMAEISSVVDRFAPYVEKTASGILIHKRGRSLTRMIAREFDAYELDRRGHSMAI